MKRDDTAPVDDEAFADWALACHDAIRRGDGAAVEDAPSDVALRRRQERFRACLRRLDRVGRLRLTGDDVDTLGAPAADGPSGPIPTRLGRFHLRRVLGAGGFGVVYLADDPRLGRQVALKVPRPEALLSTELRQRLLREAHSAARLSHPNIVPVFESGEAGPFCYLVSAYCAGGSLADWLARRADPVSARLAAHLTAALARAVQHAHERGVLHRDLKPGNILLEPLDAEAAGPWRELGFVPRVGDFGLAKFFGSPAAEGPSLTRTQAFLGTPSYMAPEQAESRPSELGPATDVYGLGAILYELLTGRQPFQGATALEILRRVAEDEPPPPGRLRANVPPDLAAVSLKCLEKQPAKRYPSAQALADDLDRFLNGKPVHARRARPWERLAKWARRRPAAAALALVSLGATLVLVAGLVLHSRQLGAALTVSDQLRTEGLEREAQMRQFLYVADVRDARRSWENGNVPRTLEILDRYLPREGAEDLRGWEWQYLKNCCRGELSRLQGHSANILTMAASPDDRFLATGDRAGVIKIWDLRNGRELRTLRYGSEEVTTVAFSPAGRLLATAGVDARVHLWDVADWSEQRQLWGHAGIVRSVAFSPDGALLASASTDQVISLWDVSEGRLVRSWKEADSALSVAWSPDGRTVATCSDDRTVKLWEATTGQELARLGPRASKDLSLCFGPRGGWLAAAGYDKDVYVWDAASHTLLASAEARGTVRDLARTPDGRLLATAEGFGSLSLWHLAGRKGELRLLRRLVAHGDALRAVLFANRGQTLFTAAEDGTVKSWDVANLAGRRSFLIPRPVITVSADNRRALVGTSAEQAALWDVESGTQERAMPAHAAPIANGAFSPQGDLVATTGDDKQLLVSDVRTGQLVARVPSRAYPYAKIAFSPDGGLLANADPEAAAQMWDPRTGAAVSTLQGQESFCAAMAFAPDGRTAAVSDWAGDVYLFDCATATRRRVLHAGGQWLIALAFSPDGSLLATAGGNRVVKVWEVASGRELATLPGHSARVYGLAFSPDGKTLASTAADRTARLWNLATGQELFTLVHSATGLRFPAFTPDGELRIVADQDQQGMTEVLLFDGRNEPDARHPPG